MRLHLTKSETYIQIDIVAINYDSKNGLQQTNRQTNERKKKQNRQNELAKDNECPKTQTRMTMSIIMMVMVESTLQAKQFRRIKISPLPAYTVHGLQLRIYL